MKASLISMQLEDLTEENESQKKQLNKDFSDEFSFLEWKQSKNELPKEELNTETGSFGDADLETSKSEVPVEIKKLYRQIALKTHPDKFDDKYLNDIFTQAAGAIEEENWMLLLELAAELRLDLDFISDETCEIIEKSIEKSEQRMGVIKSSFSFMWANQKTEKDRELFTLLFYKQFKINIEEFNDWLREHKDKKS